MAVEYPVLAILASIFFVAVVFSSLYLYLYIVSEVNRVPVVSGYAEVEILVGGLWRVNVTLRHERGEPIVLERTELVTEGGIVKIEVFPYNDGAVSVKIRGFRDGALMPGSVGLIIIEFRQDYLAYNKTYSGLVVFDKGTLTFTYTTPEA